jgi:hypothetical protein
MKHLTTTMAAVIAAIVISGCVVQGVLTVGEGLLVAGLTALAGALHAVFGIGIGGRADDDGPFGRGGFAPGDGGFGDSAFGRGDGGFGDAGGCDGGGY